MVAARYRHQEVGQTAWEALEVVATAVVVVDAVVWVVAQANEAEEEEVGIKIKKVK